MTPTFQFDETLNTARVTITARVDGTEDRAAFSVCVQREQVQDFLRAFVVATRKAAANTTEKVLLGKRDRPLFVPDPQKKPKPSDDGNDDGSDDGSDDDSDSDSDSDDDDAYNEDGELVNSVDGARSCPARGQVDQRQRRTYCDISSLPGQQHRAH